MMAVNNPKLMTDAKQTMDLMSPENIIFKLQKQKSKRKL